MHSNLKVKTPTAVFTDEFKHNEHIDVLILNSTISFRAKLSEH